MSESATEAWESAMRLAQGRRGLAGTVLAGAERAVVRRLLCERLEGGEGAFWRMVTEEIEGGRG